MAAHSILSPTTLVRPSLANTWQLFKMAYDNQMVFELNCRFSIITTFRSKNFRHGVNHHKVSMASAYTCSSSAVAIQAMFLEKTDSVC